MNSLLAPKDGRDATSAHHVHFPMRLAVRTRRGFLRVRQRSCRATSVPRREETGPVEMWSPITVH